MKASPEKRTAKERSEYSRGYAAGLRTKMDNEAAKRRQDVFLRMLEIALSANGWKIGEQPITSTEQRVDLAERWTDLAMRKLEAMR